MANFHGLERLIVLAVGLDEVDSEDAITQSRARLYCAVTRAQLFVVVVNKFERGGCLEFLGHVELRADHGKVDKTEVDREAAGALIVKQKQISGSTTAGTSSAEAPTAAEERQPGGTDPTESQVSPPLHPSGKAIVA